MDLVDPYAADMVRKIQSKGIHVFGLTARCISPDYMPEADLGHMNICKAWVLILLSLLRQSI